VNSTWINLKCLIQGLKVFQKPVVLQLQLHSRCEKRKERQQLIWWAFVIISTWRALAGSSLLQSSLTRVMPTKGNARTDQRHNDEVSAWGHVQSSDRILIFSVQQLKFNNSDGIRIAINENIVK
jgi:hypothetical protein